VNGPARAEPDVGATQSAAGAAEAPSGDGEAVSGATEAVAAAVVAGSDDAAGASGDAGAVPAPYAQLHARAQVLLTSWTAPDPVQEARRQEFLAHLAAHPGAMWKQGPPAHLTASVVVLDAAGEHVLLTLHRKARAWFQFGGHYEPCDVDPHAAATREAREESGIGDLVVAPGLVELDRHTLAGSFGRCREHLDLRFAAVAPEGARHVVSAESLDVRWWPVTELPDAAGADLGRLVAAARRQLALG
jgi:8-oxo-dGTP pyrophosphatase MutT (NUDIX family)